MRIMEINEKLTRTIRGRSIELVTKEEGLVSGQRRWNTGKSFARNPRLSACQDCSDNPVCPPMFAGSAGMQFVPNCAATASAVLPFITFALSRAAPARESFGFNRPRRRAHEARWHNVVYVEE
jgi:hypothetical protein